MLYFMSPSIGFFIANCCCRASREEEKECMGGGQAAPGGGHGRVVHGGLLGEADRPP